MNLMNTDEFSNKYKMYKYTYLVEKQFEKHIV